MKETYLIIQTKAFVIHKGSFIIEKVNKIDDSPPEFRLYYAEEDGYRRSIATAGLESSMMHLMGYILERHTNPDKPVIDLTLYAENCSWITLH